MPIGVLTAFKLLLLILLYLFLARAIRAVTLDLFGPRKRKAEAPPRPAVAEPQRNQRRPPRELVVHAPDQRPVVVPLGRTAVTFGRSERMTVALDDSYVSEEHALVSPDGDGWLVRDLGSTNGTRVNGESTSERPLHPGDRIELGEALLELVEA